MSVKFKIEGAGDIERALADLARGTAKGAARRAMKKTLQPVAQMAEGLSGGKFKVAVTSKLSQRQAKGARADRGRSKLVMYVGPVQQDGSHAPHAHLVEFGTAPRFHVSSGKAVGAMPAQPFLRPAWDASTELMLATLRRAMKVEIEKTVERAKRKAARAGK
jgi:HK97 gp10 family phage protein